MAGIYVEVDSKMSESSIVEKGDLVKIHYTIKVLEDGEEKVYDTTREDVAKEAGIYKEGQRYGPVWVVVGTGRLIDALDEALIGMKVGERKEFIAPPEKAFGERDPNNVIVLSIKRLREITGGRRITPGMEVEIGGRIGRVTKVTERFAYIDFNHPLAGKKVKFEVEVLEKATTDEEKAKALATRYFGSDVEVKSEGDTIIVKLPPHVILFSDLDAKIRTFLDNLYDHTSIGKVAVTIEFQFRREGGEEGENTPEGEGGKESGEEAEASGG